MFKRMLSVKSALAAFLTFMTFKDASASEIDLHVPMLDVPFDLFGYTVTGSALLAVGMGICILGMLFGLCEFIRIKNMPAHKSMINVAETIYATCKTYMKQQAKLLFVLECFIAVCIFYYFFYLNATPLPKVLNILLWSILGIMGSF